MKPYIQRTMATVVLAVTLVATGLGQAQTKPLTPLKVQVVLSKYEGDKKVGSLPYTLAVTANDPNGINLRIGSEIPVPGENGSVRHLMVGTIIDCLATSMDDGRFTLEVRIQDSSIMERRNAEVAPTLRTFATSNLVVLRDGQSTQFLSAADKLSGEVVRVDVTLVIER
jgi:hypothetical protein